MAGGALARVPSAWLWLPAGSRKSRLLAEVTAKRAAPSSVWHSLRRVIVGGLPKLRAVPPHWLSLDSLCTVGTARGGVSLLV